MAEFELAPGTVVRVAPPALPALIVTPPASTTVVVPVAGPPGPPGPLGSVVQWYSGDGPPPPFIPGASPGAMYVDQQDGGLWQL